MTIDVSTVAFYVKFSIKSKYQAAKIYVMNTWSQAVFISIDIIPGKSRKSRVSFFDCHITVRMVCRSHSFIPEWVDKANK